jgi:glycosyltransferase involved in cell wall biosynthesis
MRILLISHLPLDRINSGGAIRVVNLLKQAACRHEVTVVVPCLPQQEKLLLEVLPEGLCKVVTAPPLPPLRTFNGIATIKRLLQHHSVGWDLITPYLQQTVDRACKNNAFDLIHLTTPFLRRLRLPQIPIVSDAQNVEWDIIQRGKLETRNMRRYFDFSMMGTFVRKDEVACCRDSSVVMAVSHHDQLLFRKDLPDTPMIVVPNGVDTDYFTSQNPKPEKDGLIIFTGAMDYFPNQQAAKIMIKSILPLIHQSIPSAQLVIMGANPSQSLRKLASSHVVITGRVEDVRPWLSQAQVAVVPLRIGGGTRLKILEAMAMNTPVVSTPLGCEGLEVVHGVNILIADDHKSFAQSVVKLLVDQKLRRLLSQRGRALVVERYRWDIIGESQETSYHIGSISQHKTGSHVKSTSSVFEDN